MIQATVSPVQIVVLMAVDEDVFRTRVHQVFDSSIVNGGKWLGSPANIKGANKEAKIYVGRSTTLHIFCFTLIHYV